MCDSVGLIQVPRTRNECFVVGCPDFPACGRIYFHTFFPISSAGAGTPEIDVCRSDGLDGIALVPLLSVVKSGASGEFQADEL